MKLRTFLKYANPAYLWRNRRGHCTVCGKRTLFLLSLPPELVRNDAICVRCGSVSRHRHMALCILSAFGDRGIRDLADFGGRPDLSVFNAGSGGPILRRLGGSPNIVRSEYFDGVPSGHHKDGVLCQDLERMSFPDASMDLVLTEDVFEHLRDYRKGFRDVHRILKPGGCHIFSIPFYYQSRTEDLFEMRDGELMPKGPIEYHGDPVRGEIPTYSHFGFDLAAFLEEIGFQVDIRIARHAEILRHGTFDCLTFVTRKRS
jgi:SAM-dependent methyltransferase